MNSGREDGGLSNTTSSFDNTRGDTPDLNCAILEPSSFNRSLETLSVPNPSYGYRECEDISLDSEDSFKNSDITGSTERLSFQDSLLTHISLPDAWYEQALERTTDKLAILKLNSCANKNEETIEAAMSTDTTKSTSTVLAGNLAGGTPVFRAVPSDNTTHSTILAGRMLSRGSADFTKDFRETPAEDNVSFLNKQIRLSTNLEKSCGSNNKLISLSSEDDLNKTIDICSKDEIKVRCTNLESMSENFNDSLEQSQDKLVKVSPENENAENLDPQLGMVDNQNMGKERKMPIIRSVETLPFTIRILEKSRVHSETVSKIRDNNFNIHNDLCNSNLSREYHSDSMSESERMVFQNINTPKVPSKFIEDCHMSSPRGEVVSDSFGSIDITRISLDGGTSGIQKCTESDKHSRKFSHHNCGSVETPVDKIVEKTNEADLASILTTMDDSLSTPITKKIAKSPKKLLKRLSQEFTASPTRFTEKLLTLIEETVIPMRHDNDMSGVNMSRGTEEFRKKSKCSPKSIEDESMPYMPPSFYSEDDRGMSMIEEYSAGSITHGCTDDVSSTSGGEKTYMATNLFSNSHEPSICKRIYPRTPRRIFKRNVACNTPDCENAAHRTPKILTPDTVPIRHTHSFTERITNDSFEYLEEMCNRLYPSIEGNQNMLKNHREEISHSPSLDEIMALCDLQMASLDHSVQECDFKVSNKSDAKQSQQFSKIPSKTQDSGQTSKDLGYDQQLDIYGDKLEKSLLIELAEKRQRCFDTARKISEIVQNEAVGLDHCDDGEAFLRTLSSCTEYFKYVKSQRNTLQSIRECPSYLEKNCSGYSKAPVINTEKDVRSLDSGIEMKSSSKFTTSLTMNLNTSNTNIKKITRSPRNIHSKNPNSKLETHNVLDDSASSSKILSSSSSSSRRSPIRSSSSVVTSPLKSVASLKKIFSEKTVIKSGISPVRSLVSWRTSNKLPLKRPIRLTKAASLETIQKRSVSPDPLPGLSKSPRSKNIHKSGSSRSSRIKTSNRSPLPPLEGVQITQTAKSFKSTSPSPLGTPLKPLSLSSQKCPKYKSTTAASELQIVTKSNLSAATSSYFPCHGGERDCMKPTIIITDATPTIEVDIKSGTGSARKMDHTPQATQGAKKKYFFTPGKTPTYGKVKRKPTYFFSPVRQQSGRQLPPNVMKSPHTQGLYRLDYNTIMSPVGMYIKGTDVSFIRNITGKTNENMLTPLRKKTPRTPKKSPRTPNKMSPILSRSPCIVERTAKSSPLKFKLSPQQHRKQKEPLEVFNAEMSGIADSYNAIGNSTISQLPKIAYKQAPQVRMVNEIPSFGYRTRALQQPTNDKIVIRHEGRIKSSPLVERPETNDSVPESMLCDSRDISLLVQKAAERTNYVGRKKNF